MQRNGYIPLVAGSGSPVRSTAWPRATAPPGLVPVRRPAPHHPVPRSTVLRPAPLWTRGRCRSLLWRRGAAALLGLGRGRKREREWREGSRERVGESSAHVGERGVRVRGRETGGSSGCLRERWRVNIEGAAYIYLGFGVGC